METVHSSASDFRRRSVAFQRLLQAVEHNVQEGSLASLEPGAWEYQLELNRLAVFVANLREQLAEMYSLDADMISPKTLQAYSFRVDGLERTLLARQQELRRVKAGISRSLSTTEGTDGMVVPKTIIQKAENPTDDRRSAPYPQKASRSRGKADGNAQDKDTVTKERQAQQELQAQLEELVSMLKTSTTLVHISLREQNKTLDKTEGAAQRNLEGLQVELKKTEEQLKRSWSNSLTSFVMIIFMLGIFACTFLYMRLFPKRRMMLW